MTHAQGADRTGLGRLIELSTAHSFADALVTVALAGALLFKVQVGQARGQVALYLLITMVPFAVVAPFVGPILDRFRYGRRFVMAGTLFARGLLCWGMAAAVDPSDPLTLFPSALGVLVLSKAYNVSRAAIMPSVLPADITLVTANARVALFTLVAAGAGAGIATGLTAWTGPAWVLRGTAVIFLITGVAAVRLPRHVDSPDLEEDAGPALKWRTVFSVGPVVTESMRANAAIRFQGGFLVFYLLFLVQDKHLGDLGVPLALGLLAAAAGAGGLLGAAVASWVRSHSPQITILVTFALTTVTMIAAACYFTIWTAVALALIAAFAQGLGKLALDAIVQREIGEEVRSSTFGVVEALLQIAWVVGGLAGLLMSLSAPGPAGLAVICAGLVIAFGWLLSRRRHRLRAAARTARRATAVVPVTAPRDDTKPLTNPH